MGPVSSGIHQAVDLIISGDRQTWAITLRTLEVAGAATLLAALIGVPFGVAIGGFDFRGRFALDAGARAGLALPPIAVGQILWVLMWPSSDWGGGMLAGLGWLYTTKAVVLAQTLLALPVVAAITAAAAGSVPAGIRDQARAFGAGGVATAVLLAREARSGLAVAVLAGCGTAIATVGAILIVGTSLGDATLATATVTNWNAGGGNAQAVASGTILLLAFMVLATAASLVQKGRLGWIALRPS